MPALKMLSAFAAQWTMKRTLVLRSGRRHIFTSDESRVLIPCALRDRCIRWYRGAARRVWNARGADPTDPQHAIRNAPLAQSVAVALGASADRRDDRDATGDLFGPGGVRARPGH